MKEVKFKAFIKRGINHLAQGTVVDVLFMNFTNKNIMYSFLDREYAATKDEYELREYTGLKDKNGREIYEGDILEVANKSYKTKGEIVWSNHTAKWLIAFANASAFELGTWSTELYEVIGNIHENPKLLEVQA